jgi:DNA-binding transcriptional LysR family regulator
MIAAVYLGKMLCEFQRVNSGVTIDLMLMDRSVNPIEEGFDISIGALSASYGGVLDVPLCPYPRLVCAAPDYLERRGTPRHPRDLVDHDCLTYSAAGTAWTFSGASGTVSVNVHSKFNSNDNLMLLSAARAGNGIAVLSTFVAGPALETGELVTILDDFNTEELWLKAMVPESRAEIPRVREALKWIQAEFSPVPPWDRP